MAVKLKCPTILLVNPQGMFESFGDKALDDYKRLKSEASDYYLFERFKTRLYEAAPVRTYNYVGWTVS